MPKVKHAVSSLRHRKKTLDQAKGQYGGRSKLYKSAKQAVREALIANYNDRKKRKSDFRSLWINRINAACKGENISYSKFIYGLKKAGVTLNRKMLAGIAMEDDKGFKALVKKALG